MPTQNPPTDTPNEIDLNPAMAAERLDAWLDGFVRALPNIGLAIIVLIVFVLVGVFVRRMIHKRAKSKDRANLGDMMGGLAQWTLTVLGVMLGMTIIMPSLSIGDLLSGLGVSSVAIGFAFKDILQNWLAGLLILIRQPFEIGDQISVEGYEGTVEQIETRATIIRTYDGQKAVVPNSEIYTNAVLVRTGRDIRRSQYDVGIGYADDIDEACDKILGALKGIEGIETDPAPQAFCWDLAASWVTIRVRWWTDSARAGVVENRAAALTAIKRALDEARIDMPYDTKVLLLHDQTEAVDGDRNAQREGWPAPADGDAPQPRWKAKAEQEGDASS